MLKFKTGAQQIYNLKKNAAAPEASVPPAKNSIYYCQEI
jgi:hypothetical protein